MGQLSSTTCNKYVFNPQRLTETSYFLQNTTVTLGNDTVISNSMKDNPHMHYYAGIYALSMAVMLILKAVRGVVFVKVCSSATQRLSHPPLSPPSSAYCCLCGSFGHLSIDT